MQDTSPLPPNRPLRDDPPTIPIPIIREQLYEPPLRRKTHGLFRRNLLTLFMVFLIAGLGVTLYITTQSIETPKLTPPDAPSVQYKDYTFGDTLNEPPTPTPAPAPPPSNPDPQPEPEPEPTPEAPPPPETPAPSPPPQPAPVPPEPEPKPEPQPEPEPEPQPEPPQDKPDNGEGPNPDKGPDSPDQGNNGNGGQGTP